ncbi:MAG: STAS domain-containing protein [Proteobacteria bacterium]|nr:MAG: STAS domain-containing protein [Pseudomonadota bacterium]
MKKYKFPDLILENEREIFDSWVKDQYASKAARRDSVSEHELKDQTKLFFQTLIQALRKDYSGDINSPIWKETRAVIDEISRARARYGFSPSETATFVFSLKSVLFHFIMSHIPREELGEEMLAVSELLDKLGLLTTESFQKGREEIILRQQADMLELSTPVVELAENIIALPLIGTLDSNRAQTVMEVLLQSIVSSHADIAIIDITGVPTVDTLVAQHLMKTVAAARLMGADCIISGIRPQIAQTIVQLGIDLGHVHTKSSLADAFRLALKQRGLAIQKAQKVGVS